jgi:hypothetical protein
MQSKMMMRATAIGAACALAGAGAGIAGSSAATTSSSATSTTAAKTTNQRGGGPGGHARAVHAVETVLNKAGTAYITETEDSGTVKSVSGNEVTITEGTTAVPYKTVTVTIADGATIERNGKTATLADLKAGDEIHVSVSSDGTRVMAHDATFRPTGGRGHGGPRPAAASTSASPSTTTK